MTKTASIVVCAYSLTNPINMETKDGQTDYSQVSVTAVLVLHYLKQCGIEFTNEIYNLVDVQGTMAAAFNGKTNSALGGMFELRSKSLTNAIRLNSIRISSAPTIVEFAAGYSPREFILSEQGTTYYSTDLPEINAQKAAIAGEILKANPRPNLIHSPLNVMDYDAMDKLAKTLSGKDIIVTHEGMMLYFDQKNREHFASNVRETLLSERGTWLTTDISIKAMYEGNEGAMKWVERIKKASGQDIYANSFNSFDEAEEFFSAMGFNVERGSQWNYVLPGDLVMAEHYPTFDKYAALWKMTPK